METFNRGGTRDLASRLRLWHRLPIWLLTVSFALATAANLWTGITPAQGVATALAVTLLGTWYAQKRTAGVLIAEVERRKQAEQASRHANQAKSEFLANMSHELRTPLGAIVSTADLMLGVDLPSEHRRHIEVIDTSAESLLALIDDILDFAKLEAGRLRLDTSDFRLRELVNGIGSMVRPFAEKKQLDLSIEIDADLPEELHGCPARLRQVLINLANNAVKFTADGKVEIRVENIDSDGELGARFTVRDTGIGISAENRRRIFETFYQVESLSARRFGGSGLGLAISKELVRRMGGEMGVESERGVGSAFWFDLPLEPARESPAQALERAVEVEPASAGSSGDPSLVLVIDDDLTNRRLALAHLKALGYRATAEEDGPSALARLGEETFDVVLLDCQMPEMDGYETARRWRHQEREEGLSRTPIIAVTAHALPGEREKCIAVGMDDYLPKPYRSSDLRDVLSHQLGTSAHGWDEPISAGSLPVDGHSQTQDEASDQPQTSLFEQRINGLRKLGEATGEDVLGPIVAAFPVDTTKRLGEMREALDTDAAEVVARSAHDLASASAMLGAEALVEIAKKIEAQSSEGRLDGIGELIGAAEDAADRFAEILTALEI